MKCRVRLEESNGQTAGGGIRILPASSVFARNGVSWPPPLLLMFCPHPWFLKNFILDRINRLRPVPV
jgi:hypothetical protein